MTREVMVEALITPQRAGSVVTCQKFYGRGIGSRSETCLSMGVVVSGHSICFRSGVWCSKHFKSSRFTVQHGSNHVNPPAGSRSKRGINQGCACCTHCTRTGHPQQRCGGSPCHRKPSQHFRGEHSGLCEQHIRWKDAQTPAERIWMAMRCMQRSDSHVGVLSLQLLFQESIQQLHPISLAPARLHVRITNLIP